MRSPSLIVRFEAGASRYVRMTNGHEFSLDRGIMARSSNESKTVEAYRWAQSEGHMVSPNAACVLTVILTFTDLEDGLCYPKRETIAKILYNTEEPSAAQITVVSRCVSALEKAGLLEREQMTSKGKKSTNLYRVHVGSVCTLSPHGKGTTSTRGKGTRSTHGEGTRSTHHKYPVEVSKEVSNRKRGRGKKDSNVIEGPWT